MFLADDKDLQVPDIENESNGLKQLKCLLCTNVSWNEASDRVGNWEQR